MSEGEGSEGGEEKIGSNFAACDYDVAVDKINFAPVQSPDMRSSRCKKILVQGDEPQTLSVKF